MIAKISTSENPHHTQIEVDGYRIEGAVRAFTVNAEAGSVPQIQLELAVLSDLSITGEVNVYLTDEVRKALVVLGWTPPPEEI